MEKGAIQGAAVIASFRGFLDLLASPEGWNFFAVVPQDQVREQPGPAGLVRGPEPLAGFGVEILIKEEKIAPVWIGEERGLGLHGGNDATRPRPVDIGHPFRYQVRDAVEGEAPASEARHGKSELIAKEAVELLDGLDQHVIHRQPYRPAPIGIAAEEARIRFARNIFDHGRADPGQDPQIAMGLVKLADAANAKRREKLLLVQKPAQHRL